MQTTRDFWLNHSNALLCAAALLSALPKTTFPMFMLAAVSGADTTSTYAAIASATKLDAGLTRTVMRRRLLVVAGVDGLGLLLMVLLGLLAGVLVLASTGVRIVVALVRSAPAAISAAVAAAPAVTLAAGVLDN